jgi:hypothetical protein
MWYGKLNLPPDEILQFIKLAEFPIKNKNLKGRGEAEPKGEEDECVQRIAGNCWINPTLRSKNKIFRIYR